MIIRQNSPLTNFGHLLGHFFDVKIAAGRGIRRVRELAGRGTRVRAGRTGHTRASWPAGALTRGAKKLAADIARRLGQAALYLDLRLSDDDKMSEVTLKEELLKEFERGNGGRAIALWFNHKCKKNGEPAQTNVFKIEELVKLAYSGFNDGSRETITTDVFVK